MELLKHVEQDDRVQFEGDRNWCVLVVKRDLEARGIIKIKISTDLSRRQVITMNKKKSMLLEAKSLTRIKHVARKGLVRTSIPNTVNDDVRQHVESLIRVG